MKKHDCRHTDCQDLGLGYWVSKILFFHDPSSAASNLRHLKCRKCGEDLYVKGENV